MKSNYIPRGPRAAALHRSIVRYIDDPRPVNYRNFIHCLSETREEDIIKCSIYSYTHLKDILHLPFKHYTINKELASQISYTLSQAFIEYIARFPQAFRRLFLQESRGYSILSEISRVGLERNVKLILASLEWAEKEKVISTQDLCKIYTEPHPINKLTPLNELLSYGCLANLKLYCEAVQKAVHREVISADRFFMLITLPSEWGNTPLHGALRSKDIGKLEVYFELLNKAQEQGVLSAVEYKKMFFKPNSLGQTPVERAIYRGSFKVFQKLMMVMEAVCSAEELLNFFNSQLKKSLEFHGIEKEKIKQHYKNLYRRYQNAHIGSNTDVVKFCEEKEKPLRNKVASQTPGVRFFPAAIQTHNAKMQSKRDAQSPVLYNAPSWMPVWT